MTTIDELKEMYVARGGSADDVAGLLTIPEVINALDSLGEREVCELRYKAGKVQLDGTNLTYEEILALPGEYKVVTMRKGTADVYTLGSSDTGVFFYKVKFDGTDFTFEVYYGDSTSATEAEVTKTTYTITVTEE